MLRSRSIPPTVRRPTVALAATAAGVALAALAACGGGGDGPTAVTPTPPVPPVPPAPARVIGVQWARTPGTGAVQGDTATLPQVRVLLAGASAYQTLAEAGITPSYTSSDAAVLAVDARGRLQAGRPGTAQLAVTLRDTTVALPGITVRGLASVGLFPTTQALAPGDTAALWAVGRDSAGLRLPVTQVRWVADDPAVATVDARGVVRALAAGQTTVRATLNGREAAAIVRVAARQGAAFPITLVFGPGIPEALRDSARAAAAHWERVIQTKPAPVALDLSAGECMATAPVYQGTTSGVVVFVDTASLPAPTIGAGGGCVLRAGPTGIALAGTPAAGRVRFAPTYLAQNGVAMMRTLMLHELGHVLGIGSLWNVLDLRAGGGAAWTYTGSEAPAAARALGLGWSGAAMPLSEDAAHWAPDVAGGELMTPTGGQGVLSLLSVRALKDHGFAVDETAADPTSAAALLPGVFGPLNPAAAGACTLCARWPLGSGIATAVAPSLARLFAAPAFSDVVLPPLYRVDRQGRLTRLP